MKWTHIIKKISSSSIRRSWTGGRCAIDRLLDSRSGDGMPGYFLFVEGLHERYSRDITGAILTPICMSLEEAEAQGWNDE